MATGGVYIVYVRFRCFYFIGCVLFLSQSTISMSRQSFVAFLFFCSLLWSSFVLAPLSRPINHTSPDVDAAREYCCFSIFQITTMKCSRQYTIKLSAAPPFVHQSSNLLWCTHRYSGPGSSRRDNDNECTYFLLVLGRSECINGTCVVTSSSCCIP